VGPSNSGAMGGCTLLHSELFLGPRETAVFPGGPKTEGGRAVPISPPLPSQVPGGPVGGGGPGRAAGAGVTLARPCIINLLC
jgi:hypothetical protein